MLKAPDGSELPMTPDLMLVLLQVAKDLCEGRSVFITCGESTMTPRTAAAFLGMSRQFLVRLLDEGALPYHKVGSHRRLRFEDVQAFADRRAAKRRSALERLRDKLGKAGLDEGPC
jgi:excisionase family DNA binding protein